MSYEDVSSWLSALGYGGIGKALITRTGDVGRRPYASELRDLLDEDGAYRLDAVYLVEDTPTVCFIKASRLPDETVVDRLRQRLWNQNLASALLVLSNDELRAYSVPQWRKGDSFQSLKASEARPDGNWSASEFESSTIQQRLSTWFDPDRRVDRDLLRQLSAAVLQMTSGPTPAIPSQLQAQMVMAQVLFISYLEHRGIIGDEYRRVHDLGKFHELIKKRDAFAIDKLLIQLKSDFNGDFLRPREILWARLDRRALDIIDRFLSRVDLETGQRDFWNYDFSQIPVELLSGLYETFLQDKKKVDGAYYTPRVLAELAVEQAFEDIDDLSRLKVYDGACGSGILLTTAFRKIIAYQEYRLDRVLDIRERIELLHSTIYGGDINRIACRVTAFSLYLCLLERLTPSDLIRLHTDGECKLPHLINTNIAEGRIKGDFFSPRNQFAASGGFDIILSNPPWRELKAGEGLNAVKWAAEHKVAMPHKQIAAAFSARARCAVRHGGRIVLLLPSSLITAPTNADFLRQLSVSVEIDRIINLADFRRLLFAKAEHACSILRAVNNPPLDNGRMSGHFQYWMPKVDISFAFNRLTLHDYDALDIARVALVEDNSILRRRSWGSSRDDALAKRLGQFTSLKTVKAQRGWVTAKGYHMTDGDKTADAAELLGFRFLPTRVLNSPSAAIDTSLLAAVPVERGVAGIGDTRLYKGPRVLWPDGTSVEIEVRAGYSDIAFCFNSATGGIAFPDKDKGIAKFVACYLRSSLAKYWLILNGYSSTAERARVSLAEILSLPFIDPEDHGSPETAVKALTMACEKIAQYQALIGTAFAEAAYELVRDGIDDIVFDYFGLTNHERILVEDMVALAAKSLQPTSYDELFTPLQAEIDAKVSSTYVKQLEEALGMWSHCRGGNGSISVRCLDRAGIRTPLDVVHVALRADGTKQRQVGMAQTCHGLISVIQDRISDGTPLNFFAMPNSTFVLGDDIYIIKPSRVRFWTRSAALRDADELVSLVAVGDEGRIH
jgi:methylase of polypeptide subunit release factors